MKNLDLSLYLVTDRALSMGRSLSFVVEEAVKGGVTIVQLREKDCSSREYYHLAVQLKEILKPYRVPLIINDRLDILQAVNADGVHLGQSDLPPGIARSILGKDKIIGLSVENVQQAYEANKMDIDYIALSPVYATPTKTDTNKPLGLEGVKNITSVTRFPSVAIGGMNIESAGDVLKNGASGIAVVSAIVTASDPYLASRELKKVVLQAKQEKYED
jgi:thiamine-phosphate pyrophosphorylase